MNKESKLNKEAYEKHAEFFIEKSINRFERTSPRKEFDLFLKMLPGKNIIDLGSGPGVFAEYFAKNGCDPLCVDISASILKECEKQGFRTVLGDVESVEIQPETIDGIWARCILLHIPKNKMKDVAKKLYSWLKPGGVMYVGVKRGDGEGIMDAPPRFFSFWQPEELAEVFCPPFTRPDVWTHRGKNNEYVHCFFHKPHKS